MASTSLSRNTWGTATNDKIFTMSVWVKRSGLGYQQIVNSYDGSTGNDNQLKFQSTDAIELTVSTGTEYFLKTNRLFRDTSAWYHIVFAFDSTQATDSNRYKLYINGTQETSFSSVSYPPQNTTYQFFRNSNANNIGSQWGASGGFFNGQMAHFHFIDGTAYDADTFGETDSTTGIWKPKTAPSVTYGTNGFFLKFENSGAFGTDSSGNSNTFTVNGTMTQTIDTPSNVFATMNPLDNYYNSSTFTNGNNTVQTGTSQYTYNTSTLGVSSGKWYCEIEYDATTSADNALIGITSEFSTASTEELGDNSNDWGYYATGEYRNNNSWSSYGNTYTVGDIIGIALDLDNNKLYFSKNGTWQNSGDPTSGATGTGAISITDPASTNIGSYFIAICHFDASSNGTYKTNFGNGYFGTTAVSSAQNPDDGIGIFEYDVPTGYRALCTKSINAEEYD